MIPMVRILVVDDEPVTRMMVRRVLLDSGYEVVEASDGDAAVALCRDDPPDLVLMDVRMPGMNGFDACRAIRRLPAGQHLPVLMLTGLDDVMATTLAFEAGATDFITKPINWALVGQRVRYALRTNRTERLLRESQQNLSRAQRIARLAQWSRNLSDDSCHCSPELGAMLGLDGSGGVDVDRLMTMVVDEDRPAFAEFMARLQQHDGEQQGEVRVHCLDGALRHLAWSGSLTLDASGQPTLVFGIAQDVTERRDAEARLNYQAHFDQATGLPNRVLLRDRVNTAITGAQRGGSPFAVLALRTDAMRKAQNAAGPTSRRLCTQRKRKAASTSKRMNSSATR